MANSLYRGFVFVSTLVYLFGLFSFDIRLFLLQRDMKLIGIFFYRIIYSFIISQSKKEKWKRYKKKIFFKQRKKEGREKIMTRKKSISF